MKLNERQLKQGYEKPPIGLMPEYIWKELYPNASVKDIFYRKLAIKNAIDRYNVMNLDIPEKWTEELNTLNANQNK